MSNFKGQKGTGESIRDAARDVGHAVAENVGDAAGWLKEKVGLGNQPTAFADVSEIKRHMVVLSSCGCVVGVVDQLEEGEIKLTRNHSTNGQHHFIPTAWVARIDERIHLNKDIFETKQGLRAELIAVG